MAKPKTESSTIDFSDLDLRPELLKALTTLGYEEPTPVQREAIPPLLEGRDMLGQAATGTGKTAAFALPVLQRLAGEERAARGRLPGALVLVPTRELAMQVSEAMHRYGKELGMRVLPVYGGTPFGRQLRELQRGVDIVVGTPGRIADHLRRGTLPLERLAVVVLDEADEMLDMGFAEDLDAILAETPRSRQTLLFSATLPARVASIAKQHLRDPVRIEIAREPQKAGEGPKVRQIAYVVSRAHKQAALGRVLDAEAPEAALVFCRTRNEVDELTEALSARGYRAEALHGGMTQEQRDRVMGRLRAGTAELLIATDVAARGLDVEQLTHVINYDVPSAPDAYVHRIGRVGRAGREGVAITLAEPREHRMLKQIEYSTKRKIAIEKLPTVADLRARRLELTRASLREVLLAADGLDEVRVVVESLSNEFDVLDVALAAVKLAHDAVGGDAAEDERDIPEATVRPHERKQTGRGERTRTGTRTRGAGDGAASRKGGGGKGRSGPTTRIYVGAGRAAGVRPQDLVGAIANEAGIPGRDIGAIEIGDNHSLVEIPTAVARQVVDALRATKIKGKRAVVKGDW
ncbi:MAG TPA: DEAD/DEAH box helicase [Longimicrobiales bacterium]|nr:DEAD/DEAH box helicase [Longimicrobiales bacterium]